MQRFAVKKWWSVVVSERGPYVSYEEAQAMIDRLRADRDRHRNDNKLLWEQIAEQKKSILESSAAYDTEHAKYIELQSKYMTLAKRFNLLNVLVILGWGLFVITLIITAVVLRGGVL